MTPCLHPSGQISQSVRGRISKSTNTGLKIPSKYRDDSVSIAPEGYGIRKNGSVFSILLLQINYHLLILSQNIRPDISTTGAIFTAIKLSPPRSDYVICFQEKGVEALT